MRDLGLGLGFELDHDGNEPRTADLAIAAHDAAHGRSELPSQGTFLTDENRSLAALPT
jgi:hypothetical protein